MGFPAPREMGTLNKIKSTSKKIRAENRPAKVQVLSQVVSAFPWLIFLKSGSAFLVS